MITLELTDEDAAFLREQLAMRHRDAENELIHTDKREMQREIAQDLRRLEGLQEHLVSRLGSGSPGAARPGM